MVRRLFTAVFLTSISSLLSAQNYQNRLNYYSNALNNLHEQDNTDPFSFMQERGLLDVHLFNLSYRRGIGNFKRFKSRIHNASATSDIPWNMHPLQYLNRVISAYEASGNYRVAILYYDDYNKDSLTEVQNLTRPEIPGDSNDEAEAMDELKKKEKPANWTHGMMRVWYISSKKFSFVRTGFSYAQLMETEGLFRQELGVSQMSDSRSPRGNNIGLTPQLSIIKLNDITASNFLSYMLLPPEILRQLELDSINGIIVIPYANIGQIPYLALPVGKQGDSTIWFADRYAYTVAPHMCNFFRVHNENSYKIGRKNRLESRYPLVVGNPQYYNDGAYRFPDLPGAAWEARLVAEMLGTQALVGSRANYDSVIYRLKNSDMVYFATHAVPSFSDPVGGSFLCLTPTRSQPDGRLYLKTIQKTVTNTTQLAILSACQTGIGKTYKNGYCNMGRGFYICGVDNTLMSLWNLDDNNIVPFMTTLVGELQQPQPFYPAENLRQAVLKFKKSHPNPVSWAAMVNFGVTY